MLISSKAIGIKTNKKLRFWGNKIAKYHILLNSPINMNQFMC